jgi:DNA-binding CsgD family transcriptional regulator
VRNGAISGQARLFAAVGELDATPAPATDVAAERLAEVVGALVPGDVSVVCLNGLDTYANVDVEFEWRRMDARDLARWRSSGTGLRMRPTIDYGQYHLPFRMDLIGVHFDWPDQCSNLATYRTTSRFSDGEVRLLDQLRPVASRLLRRASVSGSAAMAAREWGLDPREAEVFAFAGLGLSQPAIASILGLSVGTVRTELGRAYAKTAVRSRAAATSALLDAVGPTALRDAGRGLVPGEMGGLTRRETTVLRIAATGRTTSAIASVIGISAETTKTHLANAYRKLGVQNRSQALLLLGTTQGAEDGSTRNVEPVREVTLGAAVR